MNKLVVIVGPTASGKSDLGVRLARKFGGEVVSADSRQVYRGLDIGSGKITKQEMRDVPHHLLDVVSPKRAFTVAQYKKLALNAIRGIHKRGKLAILVGGTPFYVYSVIDNLEFPQVKPNPKLRVTLARLSNQELLSKLDKLDPERASTLRKSSGQEKNKRRLIRALEIVLTTGKPIPKFELGQDRPSPALLVGIKIAPEDLKERIQKRLLGWLRKGMLAEIQKLHEGGVSWKRFEEFGLEYKYGARFLRGEISKQEMIALSQKSIEDFVRRQMLWFKKDPRIRWVSRSQEAEELVREFLS